MAWGVYDYPEPPAMTLEELWMRMHRDKDEDETDEEKEVE